MCQARRVLVVEDAVAVRMPLLLALTGAEYDVRGAVHGAHALQLLETFAPCLILFELWMPVLNGYAFARAYRARDDADAHIIVMAAQPRLAARNVIHPVQFVSKPFDLDQFLPMVEHWVLAHVPRNH